MSDCDNTEFREGINGAKYKTIRAHSSQCANRNQNKPIKPIGQIK